MNEFYVYNRPANRGQGIRNRICVVSLAPCVDAWISQINSNPDVVKIPSPGFCVKDSAFEEVLLNLLLHPNIFGVILVSQTCGSFDEIKIQSKLISQGIECTLLSISNFQNPNEFKKRIELIVSNYEEAANTLTRTLFAPGQLSIGAKCGGSTLETSVSLNPAINYLFTRALESGVSCVASEIAEYIGVDEYIAKQFINECDALAFSEMIEELRTAIRNSGSANTQMVDGNINGGLFTIEEKALCSWKKFRDISIDKFIPIGYPTNNADTASFYLLAGSHQEPKTMTEFSLSGISGVLFSTDLGGGFSHPICPSFILTVSNIGLGLNKRANLADYVFDTQKELTSEILEDLESKVTAWINGEKSETEKHCLYSFSWTFS